MAGSCRLSRSTDPSGRLVRNGPAGRVPPHNLHAEESRCSARCCCRVMSIGRRRARAEGRATSTSRPTSTSTTPSASIYSSVSPVDVVTVADELRRNGLLDEIGWHRAAATSCRTPRRRSPTPRTTPGSCMDTALLRRLIDVASEIAEIAFSEPDDVVKALDEAESKVFEVAEDRVIDSTRPISGPAERGDGPARGELRAGRHDHRRGHRLRRPRRAALGPAAVDAEHRRGPPGHGQDRRSGSGMATHVAQHSGKPVLVFSLEMGHSELTQRILSSEAKVDSHEAAHRQAERERLVEDRPGRSAGSKCRCSSTTTRRSPSWRSGPRPGGSRPSTAGWPDRDRLPAADERQRHVGEPPARGQRDQP